MKRSSLWTLSSLFIIMIVLLVACGGNKEQNSQASASVAVDTELVITATNYKFDQSEYRIKAGESVRIVLDSTGNHGLAVKELGLALDPNNKEQVIAPEKPGTYEFQCTIMCGPGHRDMKSMLIVE
ncbi:cupredoxin domain-containing protein [Paenibacillus profundus]|uniref:Cupredoxin domain-containing protein n=1 Tax=Paenibacillus profundus TaxID=1173085 RepID=A0ABS8YN16_9BACL|nr:cupredoxin domain-containing protein [Paenibacillus profundus]MCE5172000.1 cupredoxin domain-containing protein [Paenibacillus profundus]